MSWANEFALEDAREWLAERYPDEQVDILSTFDIGYVGWEMDYQGALVTHDGVPELVIVDQTGVTNSRPVPDQLLERLEDYRRLIGETEAVLERYRHLGGTIGEALADHVDGYGQDWMLQRDPGETDEAFERRKQLFAGGGRVVLDTGDLTEQEIERIRDSRIREEYRWSSQMPVIPGGAVVADALATFEAALVDPDVTIIVVPVPERQRIVLYRKLLTKLEREEYGLDEEVQLAAGMVALARDLIGGDQ